MVVPTADRTLRIALTGGPGGGKTTAADLLRREFSTRVALVPETATMLFTGGFPRVDIFFETAAVGDLSINSVNPARIESNQEAIELDRALRKLWSQHPRFHFIPNGPSFLAKITSGLHPLTEILAGARYD